jgi:hypothetical protein
MQLGSGLRMGKSLASERGSSLARLRAGLIRFQFFQDFQAVHFGQVEAHENKFGPLLPRLAQPVLAGRCSNDPELPGRKLLLWR